LSEPPPEDTPLDPETISRLLEEMATQPDNAPDFMTSAIEAMAGVHARWYRGWIAAGVPEPRAAEWTGILVESMVRGTQ